MAITSTLRRSQFTLSGAGQTLAISTWFIQSQTDVQVVSTNTATHLDTTLNISTDYSITGAGSPSGFNVVMVNGLAGDVVTVYGIAAETQPTVYNNNDAFPAKTNENALDRIVMLIQQMQNSIDRTIRIPTTNGTISPVTYTSRVSSVLGFDANGNLLLSSQSAFVSLVVAGLLASGQLVTFVAAPANSGSPGVLGQIAYDNDYFYWYGAAGWRRSTGSSF